MLSFDTCLEAAEQAQKNENWAAAEPLWRAIWTGVPDLWYAYINGADALCGLGQQDEALRLLSDAGTRFPSEPAIRHALGRLAMSMADWSAAETQWRRALGYDVRPWWIYTEFARALEEQGRFSDAEAVLLQGQAEDPNEPALFLFYARLAWKREDWTAAVERWADAHRRFPLSEQLSSGLYQALMRLAEWDPVAAERAHKELGLASTDTTPEQDMRSLMLRFESLGGTGHDGGCEFGGVQREHGAEPLGLFRWATVSPPSLIACLNGRFEGIGEAETTTVFLHYDLWEISDATYGVSMHSFVSSKEVPYDRMVILACNRMRYLKDKLIDDLENPAKTFVLKLADRYLSETEPEALSRALQTYGPNELLCVCPADSTHPDGEIEPVAPGIFVGYIDFSGRLDVEQRHAEWEKLCGKMLRVSALPQTG